MYSLSLLLCSSRYWFWTLLALLVTSSAADSLSKSLQRQMGMNDFEYDIVTARKEVSGAFCFVFPDTRSVHVPADIIARSDLLQLYLSADCTWRPVTLPAPKGFLQGWLRSIAWHAHTQGCASLVQADQGKDLDFFLRVRFLLVDVCFLLEQRLCVNSIIIVGES